MTSRATISDRIAALGPWFQNMELQGVATAPDHFLGDYPRVKWDQFRTCIPDDLSGQSVLDIGCNAGLYSIEIEVRAVSSASIATRIILRKHALPLP